MLLATRNTHKVEELRRILAEADVPVSSSSAIDAFADVPEVAETGATFDENALLKARAVAAATGLSPSPTTRAVRRRPQRDAGHLLRALVRPRHDDDGANLELVLAQLDDVPDERLAAHFACAAALAVPGGEQHVVLGRVDGHIVRAPRGTNGFGYDPIFESVDVPGRTTAELSDADKDAISHRGRALRALTPYLRDVL